ncbi:MAG: hypothetical protein IJ743_03935, partial [Bacilli bacterium]|nr:hypothetical protein [Bacilli bacterium]
MKKKTIIGLIIVLLISIVVINNNKKYISYNENTLIAVYLGNTQSNTYPSKESNYVFDASRSNCNNGATITWDEEEWGPKINTTKSYTKCDVYFKTFYKDNTGASIPELHEGMIPIKFDGTTMKTADVSTDTWYNYASHNWANAALINYSNTTTRNKYFNNDGSVKTNVTIDVNDLLQMYVWIPRYRYKLWNATMGTSTPQAIEIEFESKDKTKSSGSTNGEWLTHPAFTFGEAELNGIWVGKFEMTGTESQPTILPNQPSLTNLNVSRMFYSLYNMSSATYGINKSTTDTHMMKSMDWGAVAYLSHSIYGRYQNSTTCISSGCEVWINNINTGYGNLTQQNSNQPQIGPSITGCAGT